MEFVPLPVGRGHWTMTAEHSGGVSEMLERSFDADTIEKTTRFFMLAYLKGQKNKADQLFAMIAPTDVYRPPMVAYDYEKPPFEATEGPRGWCVIDTHSGTYYGLPLRSAEDAVDMAKGFNTAYTMGLHQKMREFLGALGLGRTAALS